MGIYICFVDDVKKTFGRNTHILRREEYNNNQLETYLGDIKYLFNGEVARDKGGKKYVGSKTVDERRKTQNIVMIIIALLQYLGIL